MGAMSSSPFATTTPFGAVAPMRTRPRARPSPSTSASRRRHRDEETQGAPQALRRTVSTGPLADRRATAPLLQTKRENGLDKITIAVLRVQGGWRLLKNNRLAGEYDYRIDAEDAGLALAKRLHQSGRDIELLVQREGSHDLEPIRGWETIH